MDTRMVRAGLIAPLVVGLLAFGLWAREQRISWDDVPDVVKATIEKHAKGAKVLAVERDRHGGGRVTYEAEFMLDGQMVEINVYADGRIRSVRYGDDDTDEKPKGEAVPFANLPDSVQKTLTTLAGKGRVAKAIREKDRGGRFFLAAWEAEGTKLSAKVTAQGLVAEMRESLSDTDVPPFIRAASLQAFRKQTKTTFTLRKLVFYEVEAKVGGRTRRVLVAPTGQILSRR